MKISIIAIGDELLIGQVTDTNSGAIARMIEPLGWSLAGVQTVADNAADIRTAIERAMKASQVVITTGGLGPTKDDITKAVMADVFGGPLVYDEAVARNVGEVFRRRGLPLNRLTRSQAMVPRSCRVIQNRLGTAPIMVFERDDRMLVAMPGVPFETLGMMEREVLPMLVDRFHDGRRLLHHTLIVAGITESDLAEHLEGWESDHPDVHLAYLPTPGLIRLRLDTTEGEEALAKAVSQLKDVLGDLLLHDGDASLAEIVLEALRAKKYTLATAESCTGGTIASRITAVPGASDTYLGGVVSYSNDVKINILGVPADVIASDGAVSERTVRAMAEGACRVTRASCAVATSGIAGPGGGTPDKPVGTVWTSVATPAGTFTRLLHCPGDRRRVIDRATTEVLVSLVRALQH